MTFLSDDSLKAILDRHFDSCDESTLTQDVDKILHSQCNLSLIKSYIDRLDSKQSQIQKLEKKLESDLAEIYSTKEYYDRSTDDSAARVNEYIRKYPNDHDGHAKRLRQHTDSCNEMGRNMAKKNQEFIEKQSHLKHLVESFNHFLKFIETLQKKSMNA